MPGLILQTDAIVIDKRPPADSFQTFHAFSPLQGGFTVLQRLPKKTSASFVALDLFDTASLLMESSNQGRTWFVKEVRILVRRLKIGRGYAPLMHACDLCAIIARNPVHEESRAKVTLLLSTALDAFETAARPDVVLFKALFRFARDEGYPVRQEWLAELPAAERKKTEAVLAAAADAAETPEPEIARLTRRLKDYLKGHTEVLID